LGANIRIGYIFKVLSKGHFKQLVLLQLRLTATEKVIFHPLPADKLYRFCAKCYKYFFLQCMLI